MGRREPRRWARAALSALALTAGGMALSACIPPPPPPPLVVVYGDSILSESQAYLSDALASTGWQVQIHAFPGTGLCDWMQTMATEDTSSRIKLVIVMHTGNWGSTVPWCTDSDWTARQTGAADWIGQLWHDRGVPVLWAAPFNVIGGVGDHPMTAIYSQVAATYGQHFVDSGASLRDVDGSWPYTLPCLPAEYSRPECVPSAGSSSQVDASPLTPTVPPSTSSLPESTSTSVSEPTSTPDSVTTTSTDVATPPAPNPTNALNTTTLPSGRIPVHKSTTNFHLCPVDSGTGACPVYSSGVVRFSDAIAAAARPLMH